MDCLVEVLPYDVDTLSYVDDDAIRMRHMKDLMFCKQVEGCDVYLEVVNKSEFIAYVGLPEDKTIHPRVVAEQLNIPLRERRLLVKDDVWKAIPASKEGSKCSHLTLIDLSLLNYRIYDDPEMSEAVIDAWQRGAEIPIGNSRLIKYTGRNSSDELISMTLQIHQVPDVLYFEQNDVRFYTQKLADGTYSLWAIGACMLPLDHPRLMEWLELCGISMVDDLRKYVEEKINEQNQVGA